MAQDKLKPFTGELDPVKSTDAHHGLKPFSGVLDGEESTRSLGAVANDTVIEVANAAAGGVSSVANFIQPGNAVSKWIDKNIVESGEAKQSDAVKAEKQKFRTDLDDAKGVGDELTAVGKYVVNNPLLTVAQAAGSFVGPGAAVKGAGALARGVGAGASAATKAGRAGSVAAGAAMAGGDAAGTAHELSSKAGATDEQAVAAGREASVIPAIVGGLGGAFGAEKLLAGAKGFAGGAAARALKTGASEALQEGIEEGVTQYEGQRAAMPYDSTIDPMKGVAGAAGMGAVMGAGTGGVVGALEGGHYTDLPKPTTDATADVSNPRAGFMDGMEASPRVDYLADVQNAIRGGTEFSTQQTVDTVRSAMEDAWLAQNVGDSESAQVDAGVAGMQAAEAVGQQLQTEFDQAGEGASIAAVDARLRTTRILEGLQNILDSGVDNSQQVSARLNESLARINEEPLQPEEVVRVRRMTDSFMGFKGVGQTAPLPTTAPKYVDENADNGSMEALIPERKSKSMGLRHEAKGLEGAAALAVDSGATDFLAQAAAASQAVAPKAQSPAPSSSRQAPDGVNADTGEIDPTAARAQQLRERIDFMNQQGRAQGWGNGLVEQRNAMRAELEAIEGPSAAPAVSTQPPAAAQPLTTEARALLGAADARKAPVVITKSVRRIAEENGIAISKSMRMPEVIAALQLRAQQEPVNAQGAQAPVATATPSISAAGSTSVEAAGAAPATQSTGVNLESQANQAQQVTTQQTKARAQDANASPGLSKDAQAPRTTPEQVTAAGQQWARMTPTEREAVAARTDMKPILKKNVKGAVWENLNVDAKYVLAAAMQPQGRNPGNVAGARANLAAEKANAELQQQIQDGTFTGPAALMGMRVGSSARIKSLEQDLASAADGDRAAVAKKLESEQRNLAGIDKEIAVFQQKTASTSVTVPTPKNPASASVEVKPADASGVIAYRQNVYDMIKRDGGELTAEGEAVLKRLPEDLLDAAYRYRATQEGLREAREILDQEELAMVERDASAALAGLAPKIKQLNSAIDALYAEGVGVASGLPAFPLGEAEHSYSGISHSGRARAKADAGEFSSFMDRARAAADGLAKTDAQRAILNQAYEQLHREYLGAYGALMQTRGGTYSGYVSGRGNLNSKQANSRNSALDKAMARFSDWQSSNENAIADAVQAARTPAQIAADSDAVLAAAKQKAAKQDESAKTQLEKFLRFKNGDALTYGKGYTVTKVNYDKKGYPSSITFRAENGAPLTSNKIDLLEVLKQRGESLTQAKERIYALVDAVRAENPDLVRGIGAIRANASKNATRPKTDGQEDAAFSRGAKPQRTFSPAARIEAVRAVEGTVNAIRKAWGIPADVIVAFDMQDPVVPETARRADLKQRSGGARGAPEGFYYRGKTYLMASRLTSPKDAARVLFHEVLGHHGLRGRFGKDLNNILNQIATMRKADVDAKIREYGLRGVNKLDRRAAAEEVLAEMAEKTPQLHFVQRAVAAIRTWLRTNVPGFKNLELTDSEIIRSFILPARDWVTRSGASESAGREPAFSRANLLEPQSDQAKADILNGEPVAVLRLEAAPQGGYSDVVRAVAELFKKQGGKAVNPQIGEVTLNEQSARDSMAHGGANAAKKVAFLAVKDVIESGALVHSASHDRMDSFYISAPVLVSNKENIVTVLVRRDPNMQRMYLHSIAIKENLLKPSVSAVDAEASELGSATTSGEGSTLASQGSDGKAASGVVATELQRLLTLDDGKADTPMFSRSKVADLKDSALTQIQQAFTHEGKVSAWDKSVGTMRHLAERAPIFKPVFEAAQRHIDDVSTLANDAADAAPRLLPRVDSLGDIVGKNRKSPVSAADNKAVAKPLFEGTLLWGRDVDGKPALARDLEAKYASLPADEKAQLMLKGGRIDPGVLRMWQGQPQSMYEAAVNARFASTLLKAGVVWSDAELKSLFKTTDQQASLYREARAGIDRSIDITSRADMLRVVGEEYAHMRDAVLDAPSMTDAFTLLTDMMDLEAKANPDLRDRIADTVQLLRNRFDSAEKLQKEGYAPLQRFGRYTVDVVDRHGERQYFGMFESMREANLMKLRMQSAFAGATVSSGTMSDQAHKLFQGLTPETMEQFGEMLGLKSSGNEAQDKAFQTYLKLAKNNQSALKRLIHRQGIAGYSEDVGRVLANFVYSNARLGSGGLNAGAMDKAIGNIPKEQGELRDVAMGLRSYIQDPQEEGQAIRGMLFAQYLGGSVASAFVNMMQPFQISMPWLSQFGGIRKAGVQMARALKDMGTKGFKYEVDLAHALHLAEEDGTVSPQEIHALMAQARGAGTLRTGDGTKMGDARATASNAWEKGKVLWGQPFALAEQFNRRLTFIASYRTAKEQGMADPGAFARKAVLETQFLYSKANKPRWARGAVGGTLFTFKTYSVSYLELMHRMWNQGGKEGKRAVAWSMVGLLLMGGAGGLPFMEDLEDLVDGIAQLMGYNVSAKQWRKEAMRDVVGKEMAEFVEQGLSGLPGAPIDVSGRLGLGNLIPGTGLFLSKPSRERDLLEVVGPAGDLISRGFSGARKLVTGDVGGAALEVSPTAVRNAAKGVDMAASGMYKDTKGYKVLDTTLPEAGAKFIGFQPKSVSEVQEGNSFMLRSRSFYAQQSSEIKAQWADALFRKDEDAVKRVRERLADWNRDNPDQQMAVKLSDVWKKAREMGKDRTERIASTAPKALRQQMREMAREV